MPLTTDIARSLFAAVLLSVVWAVAPVLAVAGPDPLAYDARAPLDAVYGPERRLSDSVAAKDVSFTAPDGSAVKGQIIYAPARSALRPGVLFVHWLGALETSNRTEFQADAVALAERGASSLLVDAQWSDRAWIRARGKDVEADYAVSLAQVTALRRALDLLAAQPGVDDRRLAVVGHDFGAMAGAVVSAQDKRVKALVFIAGNSSLADWYRFGKPQPEHAAYAARLAPFDPLDNLRRVKADHILLQFANTDDYIPAANAQALIAAAPARKTVRFYDTDHGMAGAKVMEDRLAFLAAELF